MTSERTTWARGFAVMLVVATLCNGLVVYAKRTGALDPDGYLLNWTAHCHGVRVDDEWQCHAFTSPQRTERWLDAMPPIPVTQSIYAAAGWPKWLKLVKDLLVVALLAASAASLARQRRISPPRLAVPAFAFGLDAVLGFALAAAVHGPMIAAAGLRAAAISWLGLSGRWLARHMDVFAWAVAAVLLSQLVLVPLELFRGTHLFGHWPHGLAKRLAGTLNQPNSLGVFAVTGWAFCLAFLPHKAWLRPLGAAAFVLVVCSGSATGLVCVALGLALALPASTGPRKRNGVLLAAMVLVAAVVLLLPQLTGRMDVFESLGKGGRAEVLYRAFTTSSVPVLLFGNGLGVGTNTLLGLDVLAGAPLDEWRLAAAPTDSQLAGLVVQLGLLGTGLFYFLLWRAALVDRDARPFYVAFAICSVTSNVLELFPVNLLLGLVLAHSLWAQRPCGR